jgi:Domain of unknown function (DUF4126)
MSHAELLLSIALGVGLAAAVGFRIFLPLLVVSLSAYTGHLHLNPDLAWLGTLPAVATFAVAAVIEVLAYYIPGIDNILDLLATPIALIAGTVVTAAVIGDVPPLVKWTTAAIAGGGVAGLTQGSTALLRAKSTATTGGLGNAFVSTGELAGATVISLLAVFAPIVALCLLLLFFWFAFRLARRLFRRTSTGS